MPSTQYLSNVNIGTAANDGTGDFLRDAFDKINQNFTSVYNNGQFLAFGSDSRSIPGFSWSIDRDTGMFRPSSGKIVFALNGQESLSISNDGAITWYGDNLATEKYVNAKIATVGTGSGGGSGGSTNTSNTIIIREIYGNANALAQVTSIVNVTNIYNVSNVVNAINGIPVQTTLPTAGNFEGRLSYYNGDVWIFTCYPAGNGRGLTADTEIARLAGSDCRWVRFRGDGAVTVGATKPATGVEGQTFYETSTNILYLYVSGQWKTYAAVLTYSAPAGLEIVAALPAVNSPNNYEGRTVVNNADNKIYIFKNGAWVDFNTYVTPTASGIVASGGTLPDVAQSVKGDIFKKTGTGADLYIFNGTAWVTIAAYTAAAGATAGIKTYATLPTNVTTFNAGDLIIVNNVVYILNSTKSKWDILTSNGVVAVSVTAGSVSTDQLAANAVTAAKIASGAIVAGKIAANAVTALQIAAGAISAEKIAANTITAAKIQTGAIGTNQIAANAITSDLLAAGSITAGKLAAGAIDARSIKADNLAAISSSMGTITAGVLQSQNGKMVIDLNNGFIRISN
jgi:hypothetical protein